MRACALVLQQLLGRYVREQHLQHHLRVLTVAGVGVPHGAVAQQRLWWRIGGDDKTSLKCLDHNYDDDHGDDVNLLRSFKRGKTLLSPDMPNCNRAITAIE